MPRAVTHHLLVAVGVHHPRLAVIAEAHEEGGHKVVTGEWMVVRAGQLLSRPRSQALRQLSQTPGPKNLGAGRVRGAWPGRTGWHACCVAWTGGLLIPSLPSVAKEWSGPLEGPRQCLKWHRKLGLELPSPPSACEPTYWMLESRPWVMTPVNLVVLLVSTSIHWVWLSSSAHHAPS